ncbi:S-layer family protein [Tolypothrix sp. FACHB-123]|uniref:beta strand repeat-containing protein n=1 Tax=Tolypothrix sp. FACHB-123 TaxID=2692868 RepID=UPI00168354C7|nr:S-layer family protein [Tolypothrix sp. FACHB-123]MBD2354523.1 S-layer family protein [Tolypothrix sp. FACHB-123]
MRAIACVSTLIMGLLPVAICKSAILLWSGCANAQVTSDNTTNTIVNSSGNDFQILNGIEKGNNLFHSFNNFSVPTGGSATFDLVNTANITNIFSRVTGGNISEINGLIRTINSNNSVNLFLINPKGIVFGKDAVLNISGSFIGTTANSIKFADGAEFSALSPQATPLFSMNVPIGLQMGNQPASIQVQGSGHGISINNVLAPVVHNPSSTMLQVQPGKTLALIGGNLSLNGATLMAKTGHIELGSLADAGLVSLAPTTQGYQFEYGNGQSFSDIQLIQKSLLEVSGVNAGSIQLQGRKIEFTEGSLLLSTNLGNLPSGNINLQASEAINFIGTTSDGKIRSWIRSEALGKGNGANIQIITPRLTLQQGAGINNTSYGIADSGNIQIQAANIEISGFSPLNNAGVSTMTTSTYGTGKAGDITIDGNTLLISDGASLSSVTFGQGSSGEVTINNQNITVKGENPFGIYSNITTTTLALGNAKDLTLNTGTLQVLDGGAIGSSAFFMGNGGNVNLTAREAIAISGKSPNNNSSINSSAYRLSPQLLQFFNLPNILTANAGKLSITTPNLMLTDGGTVSVTSQGTGNGGNLNITADHIQLKNHSLIQAQTESGNGGDISLQVGKFLLLRDRSNITATAGGSGNGGNININAPTITAWENSDIIANAVLGTGGNIQIGTQAILGLEFRPQLTDDSDITASSQFGVSGTVEIHNIGIDPNSGLVELPANVTDPSRQIASGCADANGSSFVATGRGGVPENPNQEVRSDRTWSDVRDISPYRAIGEVTASIPQSREVIVQATSWHRNTKGKIELVANQSPTVQHPLTCAGIAKK